MDFVFRGAAIALLLLAAASATAQSTSKSPAPAVKVDEKAYRADVTRWLAGDKGVDVTDLRRRHAQLSGGYLGGTNDLQAANKATADKDWAALLDIAKRMIAADPLDAQAHFIAERAYGELKQEDGRANEHALIVTLLRSITNGGRPGTSAQDSWTAMSVAEEYVALRLLGYNITGQSLNTASGHNYDVMSVERDGKPSEIWFNIDWFFGRL